MSDRDFAVLLDRAAVLTPEGRRLVGPVSVSIRTGEHWAVLGPNGAGKTTLLRLLGAERQPSSGTVTVLGARIGASDLRLLRSRVGVVSHAVADRLPPARVGSRDRADRPARRSGALVGDDRRSRSRRGADRSWRLSAAPGCGSAVRLVLPGRAPAGPPRPLAVRRASAAAARRTGCRAWIFPVGRRSSSRSRRWRVPRTPRRRCTSATASRSCRPRPRMPCCCVQARSWRSARSRRS